MNRSKIAILAALVFLASCSTALNPWNWFGDSEAVETSAPGEEKEVNPLIPQSTFGSSSSDKVDLPYAGSPIETITALRINRIPGGAIIEAKGVSRMQGGYSAQLTSLDAETGPENGIMTFRFDVVLPVQIYPVGSARTREITVAKRLTDQELAGVRSIRVEAVQNARVSRR